MRREYFRVPPEMGKDLSMQHILGVNKTRNMEHSGTSRNILEHSGTFRNRANYHKINEKEKKESEKKREREKELS